MNYLAHFHKAGDSEGMIIGASLDGYIKGPFCGSAISALNLLSGKNVTATNKLTVATSLLLGMNELSLINIFS